MLLQPEQRQAYEKDGYVFLGEVFSAREVEAMRAEAARLRAPARDEQILELDGTSVRSVYNLHKDSHLYGRLVADARLLRPAQALLGDDLYVHQTQLNPKAAFVGENWDWHQDFLYWQRDDGMPRPEAANVVVYLDPMTVFNGPLFLVPGLHLQDFTTETATVADGWESTLGKDLKHLVSRGAIADSVARNGMAAPLGEAGSVLIFDPRLLHASPSNVSPHERTALFVRYNRTDNALAPVDTPRPAWVAERHPQRLEVLDGSFLDGQFLDGIGAAGLTRV
jgi:ectoine hydroxylase